MSSYFLPLPPAMNLGSMDSLTAATVAAGALAALGVYKLLSRETRCSLPLPPGPRRKFLIGNALDVPKCEPWLKWHALCEKYGDIISVEAFGRTFVVLGSMKTVSDLIEHRSGTFSDRPGAPMIELMGFQWLLSRMPYGNEWRRRRRMLHTHVHSTAAMEYRDAQLRSARRFALQLVRDEPNTGTLFQRVRECIGATIIEVFYGIKCTGMEDPYIAIAERIVRRVDVATQPGTFLIDLLPLLKYVPGWFPGANFKRIASETFRLHVDARNKPFDFVRKRAASGEVIPSVTQKMLDQAPMNDPKLEAAIKDTVAQAYLVAAIAGFFLAILRYPEVQVRAQAEVDAVVGRDRLPDFSDLDRLPYVRATVSEALRWLPVTPMALPHTCTEDSEYRGYIIPKGSIVMGNAWAILHDPEAYLDPMDFKPKRFLKTNEAGKVVYDDSVRDPRVACFGFGRRICPGRHFADQNLFAVIVTVLATIDVSPCKDAAGVPEIPAVRVAPYHIAYPLPFPYNVKARSGNNEMLLDTAVEASTTEI